MKLNLPSHQSLLDNRADLRAEFQHAKRMSNIPAMRAAYKDILEIEEFLREGKCIEYDSLMC